MRKIYEIANDIEKEWNATSKNGVYFGAVPYLQAMKSLSTIEDKYVLDSAETIILYFLSNASTFKGTKAKSLKEELKQILNSKKKK